ncbi:AAA family ATPase [Shivajiella indica]|uniref:ATP-binding protein n=1 Tax=Shivajiella indica TaxID=872115 RepID=A0ABW5BAS9_9BACT
MNKIIFVTGAPGTGKSTYIKKRFSDAENFYVFDMAMESQKIFGNYDALENEDIVEIYNNLSENGLLALLDGKDLIVEYCAIGFDEDLFGIISLAHNMGIQTELIFLDVDAEVAWKRILDSEKDYFPSLELKEPTIEILQSILEDFEFNQDIEQICELGSDNGNIQFFKRKNEDGDLYFYHTSQTDFFDFEPEFEFEKKDGVNYLKQFMNFEDAFNHLMESFGIFRLYPVQVNEKYKRDFQTAYQKQLSLSKSMEVLNVSWGNYLN